MTLFPKAIIVGGITDVALSILLGIPFSIYVVESRELQSAAGERVSAEIASAVHASAGLTLLQLVIGISCSILGGYVAATIAKRDELLNGVLASWLCLGLGIYSIVSGSATGSLWLIALSVVATPLSYLAGAYLWLRRNRSTLLVPDA